MRACNRSPFTWKRSSRASCAGSRHVDSRGVTGQRQEVHVLQPSRAPHGPVACPGQARRCDGMSAFATACSGGRTGARISYSVCSSFVPLVPEAIVIHGNHGQQTVRISPIIVSERIRGCRRYGRAFAERTRLSDRVCDQFRMPSPGGRIFRMAGTRTQWLGEGLGVASHRSLGRATTHQPGAEPNDAQTSSVEGGLVCTRAAPDRWMLPEPPPCKIFCGRRRAVVRPEAARN
jgi:hypothetical protein